MKSFILLCFLLFAFSSAKSQNDLQLVWAKPLGDYLGNRTLESINRQGDKFVMGGIISVVDSLFGCYRTDSFDNAWILVTDLNGNLQWSHCYHGGNVFYHTCFGKNSSIWGQGNFIDSGYSRVTILKCDSNGNRIWLRVYGALDDNSSTEFITTSDGGGLILSSTNSASGDIPFHYGNNPFANDAWLCKLNSDGDVQWLKVLGGAGDELSAKVKEEKSGIYTLLINTNSIDYMLAGLNFNDSAYCSWLLTIDSTGSIISSKVVSNTGNAIGAESFLDFVSTKDGGTLLAGGEEPLPGDYCFPGKGQDDFALLKAGNNYQHEWCELYGGRGNESIDQIISINDSIVAIGGSSTSVDQDLAQCDSFLYYDEHVWFALVNINTRQKIWQKALCGSGSDLFSGFYYDSSNSALYLLVYGNSTNGDFTGVAYNDSGNAYLFKYGLITTGINTMAPETTLKIYPNPANDYCTLQLDALEGAYTATFTDIIGREVMTFKITNATTQIPIAKLPAGLYFVKVSDGEGVVGVGKLVKSP